MRLQVSRSKNSETFYIIKSFRDKTGKSTSKIIERLGTRLELEQRLGDDVDIITWAKERAFELTRIEEEQNRTVMVKYRPNALVEKGIPKIFSGGYLFLQKIYHELSLNKVCKNISARYTFEYDLDDILAKLTYGRVLEPASKRATYAFSKTLMEPPTFEEHHIYRALQVLAKESDYIQAELYKNSKKVIGRKDKILYYDCTNFFFEIEEDDDFRRYGHSKEHRPNPLVQMGLFMDAEGMPLAFCMNPGSTNEQVTMTPLEQTIIDDFKLSKFVVCTDAGLSSTANRIFNSAGKRQFITTQSVKGLKKHLKAWALDKEGWMSVGTDEVFNLDELEGLLGSDEISDEIKGRIFEKSFYKQRMIKEKVTGEAEPFEQRLIVTFSFKYRAYQRSIRQGQIDRALSAIENGTSRLDKHNQNDYRRFVARTAVTPDGEIAEKNVYSIDCEQIAKEAAFDGFYGLATSLDGEDIAGIMRVNANRWEIEECFRIMKSEFKARPTFLAREDSIRAHFLTCFIALLIYRILEGRLGEAFTCTQILDELRSMFFKEIRGEGYEPLYVRTDLTDSLHDIFGFRTDYEIVTSKKMKEIFRETRRT